MVERMSLITLIGHLDNVDAIMKSLIATGLINPVNSDLGLKVIRSNYSMKWGLPIELLTDTFQRLAPGLDLDEAQTQLNTLLTKLKLEVSPKIEKVNLQFPPQDLIEKVDELFKSFGEMNLKIDALVEKLEILRRFRSIGNLEDVDFDLSRLNDLEHFDVQLGTMGYEYQLRMDMNYENIDALVFKGGVLDDKQVYLFVTPRVKRKETDALLHSMQFEPIEIVRDMLSTPKEMNGRINSAMGVYREELMQLDKDIQAFKQANLENLISANAQLALENTYNSIKSMIAQNGRFFLATAWVPSDVVEVVKKAMPQDITDSFFIFHESHVVKSAAVPTKLKNNWFIRPFETIVTLYGTPNYRELDPTGFVAITYMALFGAMFGDVGQGFIFWLAGRILETFKRHSAISGVLSRIGISSIVFGVIYDSIFGIEHLLSSSMIAIVGETFGGYDVRGLFLTPIEHTNLMLILSIILGIILLLASFVMSIINKFRQNDIKEGLLGRNGVNGLILFLGLLSVGFMWYAGSPSWLFRIAMTIIVISMLVLVFRDPISNRLIYKLPLYSEVAGASYIESAFELFETLLSMLSNGVSFIRVGAFALNHAGLFIAFHTMAAMTTSHLGDIALFVIGNVVVIALEGLVVFIQGLRLIYYEMFSKYYLGDGQPFVGVSIGMRFDKQGK